MEETKYACEYCDEEMVSKHTLKRHIIRRHKDIFNDIKNLDNKIDKISNIFLCNICNKKYASKQNLGKHSCKIKKKDNQIDKILEFINKSNTKEEILEKVNVYINGNNNNNVNNIQINRTVNVNIIMPRNFGSENLEMLRDPEVLKEYVDTFMSYIKYDKKTGKPIDTSNAFKYAMIPLIKAVHFNEKYPENRNIRSINNNEYEIFNNGWVLGNPKIITKNVLGANINIIQILIEEDYKYIVDIVKNIEIPPITNDSLDFYHGIIESYDDTEEYEQIESGEYVIKSDSELSND